MANYYHVAPSEMREDIERDGLRPTGEMWGDPSGVYLFRTEDGDDRLGIEEAEWYGEYLIDEEMVESYDIWEVSLDPAQVRGDSTSITDKPAQWVIDSAPAGSIRRVAGIAPYTQDIIDQFKSQGWAEVRFDGSTVTEKDARQRLRNATMYLGYPRVQITKTRGIRGDWRDPENWGVVRGTLLEGKQSAFDQGGAFGMPTGPYDPNEPTYVRIGTWNPDHEFSTNNVTGEWELGLSVYDMKDEQPYIEDVTEWGLQDLNARMESSEPKFLVQGEFVGTGHDEEPLLRGVRVVDPGTKTAAATITVPDFEAIRASTQWAGADGGYPVTLPDGRTIWIFGDTLRDTGEFDARDIPLPLRRGDQDHVWQFMRNSFLVQDGEFLEVMFEPVPSEGEEIFWPTSGVVEGDKLQVFSWRVGHLDVPVPGPFSFTLPGSQLSTFSLPDLKLLDSVPVPFADQHRPYGIDTAVVAGMLYAYGKGYEANQYVARVPMGEIQNFAAWEFYFEGVWSSDPFPVSPMVFNHPPAGGQIRVDVADGYQAVAKLGLGPEVGRWHARQPEGPWVYDGVIGQANFGEGQFSYDAFVVGDTLIYSVNSVDNTIEHVNAMLYGVRTAPESSDRKVVAKVARTVTGSQIARGILVSAPEDPVKAQHLVDGPVTAQDILELVDTDATGIWWGIVGRDFDMVDLEAYSYGEGALEESLIKALEDEKQDQRGAIFGEIAVMLVGEQPEEWDPADNPDDPLMGKSYMEPGTPVHLTELRYNIGDKWRSVPVNLMVTALKGISIHELRDARSAFIELGRPETFSGWKAHIYCEDVHDVMAAWYRVRNTAEHWGVGAKVATQVFFDQVPPGSTQWGKGITIYFPERENWEETVEELVLDMDGWPLNGSIANEDDQGNGVFTRFEFSRDPGMNVGIDEYYHLYQHASRRISSKTAIAAPYKELWEAGEKAWFEYHCYEGHDSGDAPAWYHSHQQVTVLGLEDQQEEYSKDLSVTWEERSDAAMPRTYRVRFEDGLEWSVFEDELMTDKAAWYRPDPPAPPKTSAWTDIRAKAKRIRERGGVHIISANHDAVVATVEGDHGNYQTQVNFTPGNRQVAIWQCDCNWNTYSWGRSGRWKKYEGRMCLSGGTLISMADGTYKVIEAVQPGDWVMTHNGAGQVEQRIEREYEGDMMEIQSASLHRPLHITPNHEAWAYATPERFRKSWQERDGQGFKFNSESFFDAGPDWIDSGGLRQHDWLTSPVREFTHGGPLVTEGFVDGIVEDDRVRVVGKRGARVTGSVPVELLPDEDWSWLIGLFVAEGCTSRGTIEWSLHEREEHTLAKRLAHVCDRFDLGDVRIYRKSGSRGISCRVRNWPLAQLLASLVGKGAREKRLHPWLMMLRPDDQASLIDGWVDGDGFISRDGRTTVSTASEHLALQLQDLLRRQGHLASVTRTVQKGGPTNRSKESIRYDIRWVADGHYVNGQRWLPDDIGAVALKVSQVGRNQFVGKVYNLKVGPQESYVANGRVVHNCSHALALTMEVQSQEFGGGTMQEQPEWAPPPWMGEVPGQATASLWENLPHDQSSSTEDQHQGSPRGARREVIQARYQSVAATGWQVLAEANSNGVMVALRPPEGICGALLVEGGESLDNLHISLAVFDKETADVQALTAAVESFVLTDPEASALEGRVAGYGTFLNDDENVLYASMDIPGIDEFRVALLAHLEAHGAIPQSDHGFNPHLTLKYADTVEGLDAPEEIPEGAQGGFSFPDVVLAYAGDWKHYALNTTVQEKAAILHDEPEPALPEVYGEEEDDSLLFESIVLHDAPEEEQIPESADDQELVPETFGSGELEAQEAPTRAEGVKQPAWLAPPEVTGASLGGGEMVNSQRAASGRIAEAAKQRLAAKNFSAVEKDELIREGEGGPGARNLEDLDIVGTHYEQVEELLRSEDAAADLWL